MTIIQVLKTHQPGQTLMIRRRCWHHSMGDVQVTPDGTVMIAQPFTSTLTASDWIVTRRTP